MPRLYISWLKRAEGDTLSNHDQVALSQQAGRSWRLVTEICAVFYYVHDLIAQRLDHGLRYHMADGESNR